MKLTNQDYLRSVIFGSQDALVSTTGVIVGISIGTNQRNFILMAAFVTLIVEALSMAAGEYLSEKSVHEMPGNRHRDSLLLDSLLMFLSYMGGGLIPILPVFLFPLSLIPIMSALSAFIGLFLLGLIKARFVAKNPLRSATEMLLIGGLAVLAGLLVGVIFRN